MEYAEIPRANSGKEPWSDRSSLSRNSRANDFNAAGRA